MGQRRADVGRTYRYRVVLFRLVSGRAKARFQFRPNYLKERSVANVNGVRRLLRNSEVGHRHSLRLTAIRAALRFSRPASATCRVSTFVQAGVFCTRGLVWGRIKESHRVRSASQVIVIMYTLLNYRQVPFSYRVRKRVVRDYQFVGVHTLFFRSRILFRFDRGFLFQRTIRIFRRAIVISGHWLIYQRASDRGMIVLLIPFVDHVLSNFLHASRNNNNKAIVTINGVRKERFTRRFHSTSGVDQFVGSPRHVTRAIIFHSRIVFQVTKYVFNSGLIRFNVIKVDGRRQFSVNVVRPSVLRTILLLIAPYRLVLLSGTVRVVKRVHASGRTMLYLTIRNLNVRVMAFLLVLRRPTLFLRRPRVNNDFRVGNEVIFVHPSQGISLQFSSVVW